MKRKLITFIIALFALTSFSAFVSDEDPFTELLKKLDEFTKKYPQEKIYLQLDKPYYAVGDDIWFKAYVVDGRSSAPSTLSNILYVELINEKDSVKRQLKLPMESGISWGNIALPDSLDEGNYRIRAYTQWMRNVGPQFFFDKTIKIGNSWSNKIFTKTTNVYSTENNAEKVTSTVQFTDKNGQPYANTEVAYEVQFGGKNTSRGKTTTDAKGEIIVPILNNQPNTYKSGKIIATITLANKTKFVKEILIKTTSTATDVQFFPEGGSLVENLPSRIAFKAVNTNGLGEEVSGKIIDNDGVEVLKFATNYLGMGLFTLNPQLGKSYTAQVTLANGAEKKVQLPKVEKSGYVIHVNNSDSAKIGIRILLSEDLLNTGELKLVAQHYGNVYFMAKIATTKQLATVSVPKNEFPSGIVQFTLFAPNNLPVCERLAFINNTNDKINLTASNLKANYGKRGNVNFSLNAQNQSKPALGSFSVSVTNSTAVKPDLENESNILTSLLLTSDLTGYVEKPNHYFLNQDATTIAQLDQLLLTQGWRKINWKQITGEQPPVVTFKRERTMDVSGTITKGGKPVVKGKVSLFSNSGGFFAVDTLSDENGRFVFKDLVFADSVKFLVQARTGKDNKNVEINLDKVPTQTVTANKNTGDIEVNVNESLKSYLAESSKFFDEQMKKGFLNRTILLNEVKVVEKKNPTPNSANLNGAGRADQVFTAKDLETAFSLSQYLQGRVAGLTIQNGQAVLMRSGGRGTMQIVIDGINMGEGYTLDDISVPDIESVEILKTIGNTAIYGSSGSNGVIVITTKRGANTENNYNRYAPGIITFSPKGFYISKQFYSPKYTATPDPKPDLRTTVYWNPHIVSDATGKLNIDYFNPDQSGSYRIVVEGIDSSGNLARSIFNYQVN